MTEGEQREVIAGARRSPRDWRHLLPIARFLVEERGHLPLYEPERWGFTGRSSFQFSRQITDADWEALNRRFVIPSNIWFHQGLIRDQDNRVDFLGFDQLQGANGPEPIEVWEAKERALDRSGVPQSGVRSPR